MGGLFQSFPDPETERAFLRAERIERGQAIRALIVIAIGTLISYIILNPMHFPREGVVAYTQAAGAFIVALTGWGLEADRERSREAGCDGHLVKPVSLLELEGMLDRLQSRRAAGSARESS